MERQAHAIAVPVVKEVTPVRIILVDVIAVY